MACVDIWLAHVACLQMNTGWSGNLDLPLMCVVAKSASQIWGDRILGKYSKRGACRQCLAGQLPLLRLYLEQSTVMYSLQLHVVMRLTILSPVSHVFAAYTHPY